MRARFIEQKPLVAALLLCLAGMVVYANSLDCGFVFDDERTILQNRQLDSFFNMAHLKARRPVVRLSLAFNHAFGGVDGLEPRGYHLLNVVVHLAAGLVLFDLMRRTLRRIKAWEGVAGRVAFVATLWWLLHPLQTESVTYVIQRAESMMGLFYFATMYCVVRGIETGKKALWHGLAIASCLAGMACKAVLLTAPLIVLIFDRLFLARSFDEIARKRKGLYIGLAATMGMLLVTGVLVGVLGLTKGTISTVGFGFAKGPDGMSPAAYLGTQPAAIARYLQLAVWPVGQCVDYSWKVSEVPVVLPGIFILALLGATIWGLIKAPRLGFLGLFFFVVLSPTSSFVPIRDLIFEHRMYVPLAAVTLLLALAGAAALRRWVPASSAPAIATAVVFATSAGLGWQTIERNKVYMTPLTFWQAVLDHNPDNGRANDNMAVHLGKDEERRAEAWPYLYRALELTPKSINLKLRVAHLHMEEGDFAKARPYVEEALTFFKNGGDRIAVNYFRPSKAKANYLYGAAIAAEQKPKQALHYLDEALRIDPRLVDARINRARCYGMLGRYADAEMELLKVLDRAETDDQRLDTHQDLQTTYFQLKEYAKAEYHCRQMLQIDPRSTGAKVGLGWIEFTRGNRAKAEQYLNDVLVSDPNNPRIASLYQAVQRDKKKRGQ
ncbi:MAG: tetratricopeptide repeat protein [Planctomycetota bacterium]